MFYAKTTADGIPFVKVTSKLTKNDILHFKGYEGFFKFDSFVEDLDTSTVNLPSETFKDIISCKAIDSSKILKFNIQREKDILEENVNKKVFKYMIELDRSIFIESPSKLSKNQTIIVDNLMFKVQDIKKTDTRGEFAIVLDDIPITELTPFFPTYTKDGNNHKVMVNLFSDLAKAYTDVSIARINSESRFL